MQVDIAGRHVEVSAPMREYIFQKIQKLDKFSLKLESVHVILEKQKFHYIAEITTQLKHLRLTAKEQGTDLHSAFDLCNQKMQLQFRKHHDRIKDHKGKRYEPEIKQDFAEQEEL